MNQATRWKEFLKFWEEVDLYEFMTVQDLYAHVDKHIDALKKEYLGVK